MNEILGLVSNQMDVFAPLALGFGALLFFIDLWRSARHQQRSLMGRFLGYAPKAAISLSESAPVAPEANLVVIESRLMTRLDELEELITSQNADMQKSVSQALQNVGQVKDDLQVLHGLALAQSGDDVQTLMDIAPLSEDEADTILKLRGRN